MKNILLTSTQLLFVSLVTGMLTVVSLTITTPIVSAQTQQLAEPTAYPVRCASDGTSATLRWGSVANAQTYAIRLDDPANNRSSCLDGWFCGSGVDYLNDTYNGTSYTIRDVTPGKQYEWWVHAKNIGTWDGISNWTKHKFSCDAPVVKETTDTQTENNTTVINTETNTEQQPSYDKLGEPRMYPVRCNAEGTEATLTWSSVSAGDTYALRVDDPAGNVSRCDGAWNCGTGLDLADDNYRRTSYTLENVTPGKTYTWWVHRKYSGTWDGTSNWTKRNFSCDAPDSVINDSLETDSQTEDEINQPNISIDMADYITSQGLPSGRGIALLEEGYPHRVNVDNNKNIAFVGKNFSTNENYDVLSVNDKTIEVHYEVSEHEGYVRRFVQSNRSQYPYDTLASERTGALWSPRYPELGKPYNASHKIDYFKVKKSNEVEYVSSQSPLNTSMVVWVDYVPANVRISSVGYRNDHLIRLSQKWSDCVIEEYIYAENIGIVDWRPLNRLGCYDLNPGETYSMFGDVTGGITYQGMSSGRYSFVDGNGDALEVVYAPNFHNNGEREAFVHVRPNDQTTYFGSVRSIDDDWKLTPDFVGIHVDDLPRINTFTPIDRKRDDVPTTKPAQENEEEASEEVVSSPVTTAPSSLSPSVKTTDVLKVRTFPGTTSEVVALIPQGVSGSVVSGPFESSGYQWYNIQYNNGVRGWSAANWLTFESMQDSVTNKSEGEISVQSDDELREIIKVLMARVQELIALRSKR